MTGRAIMLICCQLATLSWPAAAQEPGRYRVAGAVVNAASSQPIIGARVTLTRFAGDGQPVSMLSGDIGQFAFTGLPPGKYELSGQRRGFLSRSYGQHVGFVSAIVTGPGQDDEHIALRLAPPSVIAGKVVDDAGEPVAQALVQLLDSRMVAGRRHLIEESSARTDDVGEYRFAALPSGSYYLVVSGVPWYSKFGETLADSAPRQMTHTGYGVRYYPNVGDAAAAEPLVLQAGQEASANFTLLPVPAVSVHIHCDQDDSLVKQYTVTGAGLPGEGVHIRQGSETGDLYNLWNIVPGHYTVRAEAPDGMRTWYGASEFDAADEDADVDVSLHAAPTLRGIVSLEGAGGLPAGLPAGLKVVLRGENGRTQPLTAGAGGRFSIPAIAPGRYRVGIAGADDIYLRNWSVEGGRRDGGWLAIPAGADVRLMLRAARGTGRIAGTVYRGGQPLAGALLVLAPAAAEASPDDNRAVESNSDGSYEFRGLPVGDYALFAVEDGAVLEYANPTAIRSYLSRAKKVQAAPAGLDHVRVQID
jgi:Carboxypeptidase regulatory-like domain